MIPRKNGNHLPPLDRPKPMSETKLIRLWEAYAAALADPSMELTCEEFTPLLMVFKLLSRRGYPFDPTFAALMLVLEQQMIWTAADSDSDVDAADQENDSSSDRGPDEDDADRLRSVWRKAGQPA